MKLEITTTPRETLVWAPTQGAAAELRRLLVAANCLVLDADPWELDFDRIPEGERDQFDPERVVDVEIGAAAYASLTALVDSGHELRWHRWQREPLEDQVWGVPVGPREA
ncbi:hypothetical protein ACQ143_13295 [Microbacterium sp. MC2]